MTKSIARVSRLSCSASKGIATLAGSPVGAEQFLNQFDTFTWSQTQSPSGQYLHRRQTDAHRFRQGWNVPVCSSYFHLTDFGEFLNLLFANLRKTRFHVDRCFAPESATLEVFSTSLRNLVEGIIGSEKTELHSFSILSKEKLSGT